MEWTGGCLCGAIRYEASQGPNWASYCHCTMCRRVSGAPFMSFMQFPEGAFRWTQGDSAEYQSSDGIIRKFCSACGTSLTFESGGMAFIALGSLDTPEKVEVQRHCYTRSKLPGIQLADGLPQFPGPVGGKGGLP
ncbi:MAG: GFA family protein [Alphaproteobacteria bacterium]|nr:GFA family protein [Alphaproteobacteria bacterium]